MNINLTAVGACSLEMNEKAMMFIIQTIWTNNN